MRKNLTILNFHGIGEPKRCLGEGEQNYWISIEKFEIILDLICKVGSKRIELTFDDGNESDIDIALPRLVKLGLNSRFFILTGKLNHTGYLTNASLKDLHQSGMKIGTHGINHCDWIKLNTEDLSIELVDSCNQLSEIINHPINYAAIPFGSYNKRVLAALKRKNFKAVYTSDGGCADPGSWLQPRTSVCNYMTMESIYQLLIAGPGPLRTCKRNMRMLMRKVI